ncbi:MAG: PKD domain-containing protein, partial [Bacteroidota bacterium]
MGLTGLGESLYGQTAQFSADVVSGCSPLTVRFTDNSTGTIHTWFWDFGNGNTSQFDDVIAVYTTPGTYTVSLTVTDTVNGSSDTRTEVAYITVFSDPAADFTADSTSGCAPLTVTFSDATIPGDGTLNSWTWDYGDGTVGTGAPSTHVYTTAGTYTVTLVVEDDNGCQDTRIYNDLITVTDVANVDFTAAPQTACSAPLTVNFNSTVTPAGSYTYQWDFGDGNGSTQANPNHTYLSNGDYTVTLTITDGSGCQEVVQKDNYVIINQPTAAFAAADSSVCSGRAVQFINNSVGADSYTWDFGDGNSSNATNPTHTYTVPGTYTVTLTANNSAGCSDFAVGSNIITVFVAPAPSFSVSNNIGCDIPLLVSFTDNSVGNIIAWDWDFGNGNFSTGQNPITTYTVPGSYTVSMAVTTSDGCQATETIPDLVLLQAPDADFITGTTDGCAPLTVPFFDQSVSPADPITGWLWNFGDGNFSTAQNPAHTYTVAGQYTVTLTVTTASGCTNTETLQYVEAGTRPTANFSATPTTVCVGDNVNFQDLTTGSATDWFWNFGDGGGSNQQNPVHAYQDTGVYTVTLIVEYLGCPDTLVIPDMITVVGPTPDFIMTPQQACNPPSTINFFDQSVNATDLFWDFGDGNTSTLTNPSNTYLSTGTYTIDLVATDAVSGCTNNITQTINITNPVAGFGPSQTRGCFPFAVNFNNSSVNANTYLWDFGDGNIGTAANPNHTYQNPGTYTVSLIASDGLCSDTLVLTNLIEVVGPEAGFAADTLTGCAPFSVTFSDSSTAYPGTSITTWQWDFGDGGTGSGPNPTYTYSNAGLYDVTLTVLDDEGCQASTTISSYIQPT